MNKKHRHLAIRGILINGEWVEDRTRVKCEFYNHFANRFDVPNWLRPETNVAFPRSLETDQAMDLEANITIDGVKRAVWECGKDKAPGPDGFTFDFLKSSGIWLAMMSLM